MWAEHIQANLRQLTTLYFSLLHFPLVLFCPFHLFVSCLWSTVVSVPPEPSQDSLCSVREVLEGHGDGLYCTMAMLLSMSPPLIIPSPQVQLAGFALFYLSFMSVLCAIYVHLAPCVWSYNMWQDNADMWNFLVLRVLETWRSDCAEGSECSPLKSCVSLCVTSCWSFTVTFTSIALTWPASLQRLFNVKFDSLLEFGVNFDMAESRWSWHRSCAPEALSGGNLTITQLWV